MDDAATYLVALANLGRVRLLAVGLAALLHLVKELLVLGTSLLLGVRVGDASLCDICKLEIDGKPSRTY